MFIMFDLDKRSPCKKCDTHLSRTPLMIYTEWKYLLLVIFIMVMGDYLLIECLWKIAGI